MIEIRAASAADADALAELRWEFRAPRAAQTESRDAFVLRCAGWMRAELSSGRWKAWVAVEDARIVGQAWMYFMPRSSWYRKNWWCSGVRSSLALMTWWRSDSMSSKTT